MHYFHYTDINAVHSIVKNRKLWLTDLRYMNDTQELREGLEHVACALTSAGETLGAVPGINQTIEYIANELAAIDNNFEFEEPLFVLSLSERDDMLSQWRAYGKYSICLDSEVLEQAGLHVASCVYDQEKKTQLAQSAIDKLLRSRAHQPFYVSEVWDSLRAILELAATFKHAGFKEERETRLILNGDDRKIRYRTRGNMLIPYVEVDIPIQAVRGVRVGPIRDASLARASLHGLANVVEEDFAESQDGYSDYTMDIEKSIIPYRD